MLHGRWSFRCPGPCPGPGSVRGDWGVRRRGPGRAKGGGYRSLCARVWRSGTPDATEMVSEPERWGLAVSRKRTAPEAQGAARDARAEGISHPNGALANNEALLHGRGEGLHCTALCITPDSISFFCRALCPSAEGGGRRGAAPRAISTHAHADFHITAPRAATRGGDPCGPPSLIMFFPISTHAHTHAHRSAWSRLGTSICQVRRDQKGAGSYCVRHGMQLVPTELWLRQRRILPSGAWDSADS